MRYSANDIEKQIVFHIFAFHFLLKFHFFGEMRGNPSLGVRRAVTEIMQPFGKHINKREKGTVEKWKYYYT